MTGLDRGGVGYAVAAFSLWGVLPIHFKLVQSVDAVEILAHRVAWSAPVLLAILWASGKLGQLRPFAAEPARLLRLLPTAVLLLGNWLVMIIAINTDRILESSLGYFISPLVNVALGMVFLGERLRPAQAAAIALAALGVAVQVALAGVMPWLGLGLAASWGAYTILRKMMPVDGDIGLTLETVMLAPLAVLFVLLLGPAAAFGQGDAGQSVLLAAMGVSTALPLLWYGKAARRLPLTVLGVLNYIGPSMQFLLAVMVFGETFDLGRAASFALIWAGVAVFISDLARRPQVSPGSSQRA